MPNYAVLARLTDQDARTMRGPLRRLAFERATSRAQCAGVKQISFATGQYDHVVIAGAPDDETMTRVALAVSAQGNVRTDSFRVFTEEGAIKLIGGLR